MAISLPIVSKFDPTGVRQAEGALGGFGKNLGKIAAGVGAAFSVGAIFNFAKSAMLAAEEAQAVNNILVKVAENTLPLGTNIGAATDRMIKFADAQEVLLGVDGELIKSTQAKLLGFASLTSSAGEVGGVFDRSLSASFDLATARGKDVGAMSTALGKALEDPIGGLGGLTKAGIIFSDSQKEVIAGLEESGDRLGAQEFILSAIEAKYGGAAEAGAKGSARLANAMENLMETAGEPLLGIFANLVTTLQPVLELVGTQLADAFTQMGPILNDVIALLPSLIQSFMPVIPIIGELIELIAGLVVQFLPLFVDLFNQLLPVIMELAPIIADVLLLALEALVPVFMTIVEALMPIVEALLPVFLQLVIAFAPIVIKLIEAFMPLIMLVLPMFIKFIEFITPLVVWLAELLGTVLVVAVDFLIGAFEKGQVFFEAFGKFFQNLWIGIQIIFATVMNGLIEGFENFINFFVNGFNTLLGGINKVRKELKQTELSLVASVKFGRIDVPELVPMATGGIVTRPTNALIGEAGPEAVIPLSKLGQMGGGATYNITVNAGMGTNGAQLGQEIVSAIKRYERASGPVFASA
jgi:phage-related protein